MQAAGFSLLVMICFLVLIVVFIVAVGDKVFGKGIACLVPGGAQGGGGYSNFLPIRRLGPSIYR